MESPVAYRALGPIVKSTRNAVRTNASEDIDFYAVKPIECSRSPLKDIADPTLLRARRYADKDLDAFDEFLRDANLREIVARYPKLCYGDTLVKSVECAQAVQHRLDSLLQVRLGKRLEKVSPDEKAMLLKGPFTRTKTLEMCGTYSELAHWNRNKGHTFAEKILQEVESEIIEELKCVGDFPKTVGVLRIQMQAFWKKKKERDKLAHLIPSQETAESFSRTLQIVEEQINKDNLESVHMKACSGLVSGGIALQRWKSHNYKRDDQVLTIATEPTPAEQGRRDNQATITETMLAEQSKNAGGQSEILQEILQIVQRLERDMARTTDASFNHHNENYTASEPAPEACCSNKQEHAEEQAATGQKRLRGRQQGRLLSGLYRRLGGCLAARSVE